MRIGGCSCAAIIALRLQAVGCPMAVRREDCPGRRSAKLHAVATVLLFGSLELGPLVGRKDIADAEKHLGVCFFEFGTSLGGLVDLGEDLVRVGLIGGEHRPHQLFLLLEIGPQVDQLEMVLLKDVVHALLLIGCKGEFLNQVRVMPPDAWRADAEAGVHAHGPIVHLTGKVMPDRVAGRWRRVVGR